MSLPDRILPLCDLLLGAAHADQQLQDRERQEVRELLAELTGAALTKELEHRIEAFDPARFDLAATAAEFRGDPEEDRRRLLSLVAAVHDADDELDLAEDDYLRALAGLTLEIEVEELRGSLDQVRKGPPPPPKQAAGSVDVDLD